MVWVAVIVKTLLPLIFTVVLCKAQEKSKDVELTSLNEYMRKMDAVLHEVQSHSQAQEQKYSAVLSSVLSQLTQTTVELRTSKNVTEELQQEVHDLKEELKNLKETNKNTLLDYATALDDLKEVTQSNNRSLIELAELNESYNGSLVELEVLKSEVRTLQQECSGSFSKSNSTVHGLSQLNSTQAHVLVSLAEVAGQMNATAWQYKDIGFEAYLAGETSVLKSGRIVFDQVNRNEGNGYNKTTGSFTAPESGTYMFWTNIIFKAPRHVIVFYVETNETTFSRAYGCSSEHLGIASTTTSFYLKKGECTWIRAGAGIAIKEFTSAGAVLIKQY